MPEPILTKKLMPLFDMAIALGRTVNGGAMLGVTSFGGAMSFDMNSDGSDLPTEEAMIEVKNLMNQLPRENYDLLYEICKLLRLTSANSKATKMPLSNLMLVFCPTMQLNPPFLKLLVERQDYLFGQGDMGPVASPCEDDVDDYPPGLNRMTMRPRARGRQDEEHTRNWAANPSMAGFAVAIDAALTSNVVGALNSIPAPSRTPTNSSLCPPSTTSLNSSAASTASRSRVLSTASPLPSPAPSLRSRAPARRQPSLASLFSSNKPQPAAPVISSPLPYIPTRSATPSEPPVLDIELPDGSFSVRGGKLDEARASSLTPPEVDSPPTSDSETFRIVPRAPQDQPVHKDIPRQIARTAPPEWSPPPRIPMFEPAKRSTGDDWATSVLAAGRNA